MKKVTKESWHSCPKCGKESSVKYVVTELEEDISVKVYKCNNCKYQSGVKELWDYQYKNQDNL